MEEVAEVLVADSSWHSSLTINGVKLIGKCMAGLEIFTKEVVKVDQLMTGHSLVKMVLMVFMPLNHAKLDSVDLFVLHAQSELSNMTSLMVFANNAKTSHITLTITKLEVILLNVLINVTMEELMFITTQSA